MPRKWSGGEIGPTGKFYIRRRINGRRFHVSTGCTTREGARAALAVFEQDPEAFLRGIRPAADTSGTDFEKCVEKYLEYSAGVKGNSAVHVCSQGSYFDNWKQYLTEKQLPLDIRYLNPETVDGFIAWRRAGGVKRFKKDGTPKPPKPVGPDAIALDVVAIKALLKWATRPGMAKLAENPLRDYPVPKRPKDTGKVKTFPVEWWTGVIRPRLPLELQEIGDVLLGSQMRWSSLARLALDDIDTQTKVIHLLKTKGRHGIDVAVSDAVVLAARNVVVRGVPKKSGGFDRALREAAKDAEVDYFSAHCFRHTGASLMLKKGEDLKAIQARLGHADLQTTQRYCHRITGGGEKTWRGPI
jgi:integrase